MTRFFRKGFALLASATFSGALAVAVPCAAAALSGVSAVGVGQMHACAIVAGGAVKCWGRNDDGEVSDSAPRGAIPSPPVDVGGLSGVVALALGENHTCALTSAGGVKCWGDNYYGQLGDGTTNSRPYPTNVPTDVPGLTSGVVAISAMVNSTCAVTAGGAVKCWGLVSVGSPTVWPSPTDIPGGGGAAVAGVAVGRSHGCVLTAAGGVQCWGQGSAVGAGSFSTTYPGRTDVTGLTTGVAAIASGADDDYSCALTSIGGVKCWGANAKGQLGDGTTTERATPVDVTGLASGVASLAPGGDCVVMAPAGGVKCWGYNFSGQVGDGTDRNRTTPVDVLLLGSGAAAVARGPTSACAVLAAGEAKCWARLAQTTAVFGSTAVPLLVGNFTTGQTLTFGPLGTHDTSEGPLSISAVSRYANDGTPSGLPVAFLSVTPANCSVSGSTVALTAMGICSLYAIQDDTDVEGAWAFTSFLVTDTVNAPGPRLGVIATRSWVGQGNDALFGGFIIGGSTPKTVVLRARGPSLVGYGITDWLQDPALTLFDSQASVTCLSDLLLAGPPSAMDVAVLKSTDFWPDPPECAMLMTLAPGAYTMQVQSRASYPAFGYQGIGTVEVFEIDHPESPLVNISTRGRVLTGDDVMIAGFVIYGNSPQTVVVSATGPSLAALGVTGVLANPALTLVRSADQSIVATNDDWQDAPNAAAVQASGFAPADPHEAAIMATLPPGAYTAIVRGAGGGTGVAVVGVFAVP